MRLRDLERSLGRIAPNVETTMVIAMRARDMISSTISVYPFMEQERSLPLVPSAAVDIIYLLELIIIK